MTAPVMPVPVPGNDDDDDLPALRAPATGRRSDEAFARRVRAGVDAARGAPLFSRRWLAVPALIASAAAVLVVVGRLDARADARAENGRTIAFSTLEALADDDDADLAVVDVDDVEAFDDDTLIALAGGEHDENDDDLFAIPALDGSTPRELRDIEAALDRALQL